MLHECVKQLLGLQELVLDLTSAPPAAGDVVYFFLLDLSLLQCSLDLSLLDPLDLDLLSLSLFLLDLLMCLWVPEYFFLLESDFFGVLADLSWCAGCGVGLLAHPCGSSWEAALSQTASLDLLLFIFFFSEEDGALPMSSAMTWSAASLWRPLQVCMCLQRS